MRIHYLQHTLYEDLGNIKDWAQENGHKISCTKLYAAERLPEVDKFDWLIILGGPMNIYEEKEYPWLALEKKFIGEVIEAGKIVLGICLGAQLIADVLGGQVTRNEFKEIGWFKVQKTLEENEDSVLREFPQEFLVFQWHGDTFSLPPGAIRLAESEACQNQAFQYKKKVLGLQFHLEFSEYNIRKLLETDGEEITDGKYMESAEQIAAKLGYCQNMIPLIEQILNRLAREVIKMD